MAHLRLSAVKEGEEVEDEKMDGAQSREGDKLCALYPYIDLPTYLPSPIMLKISPKGDRGGDDKPFQSEGLRRDRDTHDEVSYRCHTIA